MSKIDKKAYADMFGPTTGDRVRLGDTELIIEVEKDLTHRGSEVKFGGGKVIRDGQGQSQLSCADTVDTVITNALIVDYSGIYKADIGLKDGRIQAIGSAGNPDVQDGITFAIGPGTEVIAGEGLIVTAGGIDSHVHFICPQQGEEALSSGLLMPYSFIHSSSSSFQRSLSNSSKPEICPPTLALICSLICSIRFAMLASFLMFLLHVKKAFAGTGTGSKNCLLNLKYPPLCGLAMARANVLNIVELMIPAKAYSLVSFTSSIWMKNIFALSQYICLSKTTAACGYCAVIGTHNFW